MNKLQWLQSTGQKRTNELFCCLRGEDELVVTLRGAIDIGAEGAVADLFAVLVLDLALGFRQTTLEVGQRDRAFRLLQKVEKAGGMQVNLDVCTLGNAFDECPEQRRYLECLAMGG